MYKIKLTSDEELELSRKVLDIATKVSGTSEDIAKGKMIRPKRHASDALLAIADAYCQAHCLSTLDSQLLPDEGYDELREVTEEVACEVEQVVSENLLYPKKEVKGHGQNERVDTVWKPFYPANYVSLPQPLVGKTFELKKSVLRKMYLDKIDEVEFDNLLTNLLTKLWFVEDYDSAFKFFKLWMINAKTKRFYPRLGENSRNPKVPIWLSLWSEKMSIGKSWVVEGLCLTYENLFNCVTKSIQFKDFNKQFKGFVGNGIYICHVDESDRIERGMSDPNTVKSLISEIRVNAERKGVDNTRDEVNNLSFVSSTNQRVEYAITKTMEENRRLAEIHIVGACDEWTNNKWTDAQRDELMERLWTLCPVETNGLELEVRNRLIENSRVVAEGEFYTRLLKVMSAMSWGDRDDGEFKPWTKGRKRVPWSTEVKDAYTKEFALTGGWSAFSNFASTHGIVERSKAGQYVLNFKIAADGVLKAMREDNEK